MIERIRRIVTGEVGEGPAAVFTHVEEVEPLVVGESKLYWIWGYDETPTLPYHSTEPYEPYSMFPPPNGLRVTAVVFPPKAPTGGWTVRGYQGAAAPAGEEAAAEKRRQMTEAVPHGRLKGSQPTMHRTDTIDFGFVLSGEVVVELEDGGEQTMGLGDVYIQNGAMHAWRNDGSEPAVVAFVNVPAKRAG
jgi:mannose-6-phosphate isomerase-like protein (cupin superfamily)